MWAQVRRLLALGRPGAPYQDLALSVHNPPTSSLPSSRSPSPRSIAQLQRQWKEGYCGRSLGLAGKPGSSDLRGPGEREMAF